MASTFNDGDPIDAASLQQLLERLAKVEAVALQGASAGSSINVVPKTGADSKVAKFFGGFSEQITFTPGAYVDFTVEHNLGVKPTAIAFGQIYTGSNDAIAYVPQVRSMDATTAKCRVRCPSTFKAGKGRVYFIAVYSPTS
jgi:hypothetical protein